MLTDPTYRENARKLQKAITEANGLSVAANFIEESLGAKETVRVAAGQARGGQDSSNNADRNSQTTARGTARQI